MPAPQFDNTGDKAAGTPGTPTQVQKHPGARSSSAAAAATAAPPFSFPHLLPAPCPFSAAMRAVHIVSVSGSTLVTRVAVRVGLPVPSLKVAQAVLEVRGQQRSGWAWQPAVLLQPQQWLQRRWHYHHVLAPTLSRCPQIFPASLLAGGAKAINTASIKANMGGSANCQQTFVVPATGSAYVTIKLPGSGCILAADDEYAIALRTASGNPAFDYWPVGTGAAPDLAGVWAHVSFRTWDRGVLSEPLAAPDIASLQIVATY